MNARSNVALPLPLGADREHQALNARVIEAVLRHIRRTWRSGGACLSCGKTDVSIYPGHKLTLSVRTADSRPGTLTLPTAAVVCRACGRTELVNLVVAGVSEEDLNQL